MFRLRTFGGCFLERDGTRLDGLSAQRKGLGLLALLAAADDAGVSRDAAATSLWPDSDDARAAASLKQLVHSIRQQLGSADILLGPSTLRLNPALVTSDLREFRDAMQRGDAETAVALYAGPFLDGFFIRGADPFERQVAAERAVLARQHDDALETLAEQVSVRGDLLAAVQWWRRRQATDPLNGRVAVCLMRALDASGDRAGALRHAGVHAELLRQEIGPTATDPAVAALAAELTRPQPVRVETPPTVEVMSKAGERPAPAGSVHRHRHAAADTDVTGLTAPPTHDARVSAIRTAAFRTPKATAMLAGLLAVVTLSGYGAWRGLTQRRDTRRVAATSTTAARIATPARSVAVLPFQNTSGDTADEPFADGLTDELIGALGQVAGLKVAPRTSSFALKGKGLDVRTVADTLGVATALEGSVRRAGERLRITVALVSAAENRVLWSESYDRERRDVFAVQQDIARSVVNALQVTLVAPAGARLVAQSTADHVAYEFYLKGEFFRLQTAPDALRRSIGFFEQAIARDPAYARAHAGLADALALQVLFGDRRPLEGFQSARRSAMTALSLDSTLAQAHASLGHIEMAHDWNWASAGRRLEQGMRLDPTSTTIRLWRGLWLLDQRRFGESAALLERALAADPLSAAVSLTLGRIYVSMGQPDRALPYLNTAIELNPRLAMAHQQLGHALLQRSNQTDAIAAFRRAAALSGARDSAQLAYAYAVTGRRDEATRIVGTLIESAATRYVQPFAVALAYAGLGDADAAFRWLEQAYQEHAAAMDTIAITTAFAPLHADPRWPRLLRRMGLPT